MNISHELQVVCDKYTDRFRTISIVENGAAPVYDTLGGMFDIIFGNSLSLEEDDRWGYRSAKNYLNKLYTRCYRHCLDWYYLNEETVDRAMKLLDTFDLVDVKTVDFIIQYSQIDYEKKFVVVLHYE